MNLLLIYFVFVIVISLFPLTLLNFIILENIDENMTMFFWQIL